MKFQKIYLENYGVYDSELILKQLNNYNVHNYHYFCESCRVELQAVLNVKNPYFKTYKNKQHKDDCKYKVERISREKRNSIDQYYDEIKDNKKKKQSLISKYFHDSHSTKNDFQSTISAPNHSNNYNDSFNKKYRKQSKIPSKSMNKKFKELIFNMIDTNESVYMILYGKTFLSFKNQNKNFKNYDLYLKNSDGTNKLLCSIGCNQYNSKEKMVSKILDDKLECEVQISMIARVTNHYPFINIKIPDKDCILIQ